MAPPGTGRHRRETRPDPARSVSGSSAHEMRSPLQLTDDPHGPRGEPQFFAARLLGRHLPLLTLPCTGTGEADLGALGEGALVLFCFAGLDVADTDDTDVGFCRAYNEHLLELVALGAKLAGVCCSEIEPLEAFAAREGVTFPLYSDPDLRLGSLLGLPSASLEGRRGYERLSLVARRGKIEKVFHPAPARDVNAVLAWISEHS
jgi:peroxiredoxin